MRQERIKSPHRKEGYVLFCVAWRKILRSVACYLWIRKELHLLKFPSNPPSFALGHKHWGITSRNCWLQETSYVQKDMEVGKEKEKKENHIESAKNRRNLGFGKYI